MMIPLGKWRRNRVSQPSHRICIARACIRAWCLTTIAIMMIIIFMWIVFSNIFRLQQTAFTEEAQARHRIANTALRSVLLQYGGMRKVIPAVEPIIAPISAEHRAKLSASESLLKDSAGPSVVDDATGVAVSEGITEASQSLEGMYAAHDDQSRICKRSREPFYGPLNINQTTALLHRIQSNSIGVKSANVGVLDVEATVAASSIDETNVKDDELPDKILEPVHLLDTAR